MGRTVCTQRRRRSSVPIGDRLSLSAPDLRANGPVAGVGITPPPGFDEGASYAGAFAPGEPAWTDGWTAYPLN